MAKKYYQDLFQKGLTVNTFKSFAFDLVSDNPDTRVIILLNEYRLKKEPGFDDNSFEFSLVMLFRIHGVDVELVTEDEVGRYIEDMDDKNGTQHRTYLSAKQDWEEFKKLYREQLDCYRSNFNILNSELPQLDLVYVFK